MTVEKFIPPFIEFVNKNFDSTNNKYVFISSEKYLFGLRPDHDGEFLYTPKDFKLLEKYMSESRKIILHGLWRDKVDDILVANPKLMSKCYWAMWGGDFYFPDSQSPHRHLVIKNLGFLVSANARDIAYVRQHYGATGKHINSLVYVGNIFIESPIAIKTSNDINIQVGNSAGETNQHEPILLKLSNMKNQNMKIFCPLSYGCHRNAKKVKDLGHRLFSDNFHSLDAYMDYAEYLSFLSKMDLCFFNAPRQQSFGNILCLLGMGKKVFINNKSNLLSYFADFGVTAYDIDEINLSPISKKERDQNMRLIRKHFTEENLRASLEPCFE